MIQWDRIKFFSFRREVGKSEKHLGNFWKRKTHFICLFVAQKVSLVLSCRNGNASVSFVLLFILSGIFLFKKEENFWGSHPRCVCFIRLVNKIERFKSR